MRRRSYRYIFYFNIFFVVAIVIVSVAYFTTRKNSEKSISVSIVSPLLHSESISADFCKTAKSAVLIDAKSGAVLYEKNAYERLPMASTTKIMTALAVIEKADFDKEIVVSKNAAGVEGSSIYLVEGERISVTDLLYGLLLKSGNDAAVALAEGVFGSQKDFLDYVNKRVHEMGLIDTSFANPHGLDDDNHYTTAYELALLSKKAMENDMFRQIVSCKSYTTQGENKRYFSNNNKLLSTFEGTIGIKTGYTSKAGRCLVTCAKFGDEEYIAVTLSDPLDWQDHKDMHTFAEKNYDSIEIATPSEFVVMNDFSVLRPKESVFVTLNGSADFKFDYSIEIENDVGKVSFSVDGKPIGSFGIVDSRG